jgi:hypothetical protein
MDTQTGKPIENVNVFVGNNGTTTNSNGSCNLDIFNKNDQITFSMIGYRDFTLPFSQIPEVVYLINESIPMELVNVVGKSKKSRNRYIRLERNVRKVYPYANKISELLVEYSSIIDSLEEYSGIIRYQKKREIFSKIEEELISKYGHSIKKLTKSQGRILIRLVDRETNRTSYKIIKDFRNIFSAGFWQITARVFGHNLRSIYNPDKGEDRMIEYIINRIEKKINS